MIISSLYFQPMERFVTDDCGLTCLCVGNNNVECQQFGCGNNAICDVQNGIRGCYCEDGYELLSDGKTCESRLQIIISISTSTLILKNVAEAISN